MSLPGLHLLFDGLAFGLAWWLARWTRKRLGNPVPLNRDDQSLYFLVVVIGLVGGSLVLGTLNLVLAGQAAVAKSLLGGLGGGILGVEVFKKSKGIRGSTGVVFVPGFAFGTLVGRLGCFWSGLEDFTYGIPTALPWAVDFGDGIGRHPVQLYEGLSMGLFGVVFLATSAKYSTYWKTRGFYLLVGAYALQRFLWEFLKPYPQLIGPLNLFHLTALLLGAYAWVMHRTSRDHHA